MLWFGCALHLHAGAEHICRAGSSRGFGFESAPALALLLIQPLQTVRAGRAPLYPGPLCGGEVESIAPEGRIDMDVAFLLVTFLLAIPEKSDSPSAGARTLCTTKQQIDAEHRD
jgi:hypothetical protein